MMMVMTMHLETGHSTRTRKECKFWCGPKPEYKIITSKNKTYLIKSAIEIIFKPSLFANSRSLGKRAIEPSSSSTISHKTATGGKPASVARSTEASVCPALFRTPPSLYFKGKICPGRLKSSGFEVGEARLKIVLALSMAETPVVVPSLASYRKTV